MHIFLSLRKIILGRLEFFYVIVKILFLEHEDDRLKEQKCQVLFLVALGKIMDFSTTITYNLLLHKCKTGFGKKNSFGCSGFDGNFRFQFIANHHTFL